MNLRLLLALTLSVSLINADVIPRNRKIVGGIQMPIENAPYQVSVMYRGYHTCGGSIISPSFVLTACHCTSGKFPSDFSIRAGSNSSVTGGEIVAVSNIYNHPQFDSYFLSYDYALLELASDLVLDGKTKAAIKLPLQNALVANNIAVIVSGWGSTKNASESPEILRAVTIFTIEFAKCNDFYRNDGGLDETQFCAGTVVGGKDACYGDSGGPLVDVNSKVLVGVVSWGIDCALPRYPGVYSKISFVIPWIKSYVKDLL